MPNNVTYRLTVRRGPQPDQIYDLTRDSLTIGRDITNDIVINDPEVSRHHARLTQTGTGYVIEDLRSTNGTFVNQQRIAAPRALNSGDQVGLGETVVLSYEAVGAYTPGVTLPAGAQAETSPAGVSAPGPPPPQYQAAPPQRPPSTVAPIVADEGDVGPDRSRWIAIGCGCLTLLVCCALVAAALYIDANSLWCDLPLANLIFSCPGVP
jgi:pSer/pThr/pTyr-binding forkhead associated (FHA) protein